MNLRTSSTPRMVWYDDVLNDDGPKGTVRGIIFSLFDLSGSGLLARKRFLIQP